jgi:hypothetical protein
MQVAAISGWLDRKNTNSKIKQRANPSVGRPSRFVSALKQEEKAAKQECEFWQQSGPRSRHLREWDALWSKAGLAATEKCQDGPKIFQVNE